MPQTGYWTTNLLDAQLQAGNVELTFPISDREVNGGRAWARRRYPFRNGQSDEDTGANPRSITYTVPLFRDVEESDYPNLFFDLIELFESDEHLGRATLTDPEFGPLPVRLVDYAWSTSSKERDGGQLRLSFETLGHENFLLLTSRGDGAAAESLDASEDAARVDDALAEAERTPAQSAEKLKDKGVPLTGSERTALGLSASFGVNVGLSVNLNAGLNLGVSFGVQLPALPSFTTSVTSTSGFGPQTVPDEEVRLFTALTERFQERISAGTIRSSDEIGAELDVLLARIAAVRDDEELLEDPERGWPLLASTSRLIASVRRVAERAFDDAPLVVDYQVRTEQSAVEVAVALFANPNRVQDIIDLNPGLSPDFYQPGTTLAVPLE